MGPVSSMEYRPLAEIRLGACRRGLIRPFEGTALVDPFEDLEAAAAPTIGRNWNRLSPPDERRMESWETIELFITAVVSAFFVPYLKVLGEQAAHGTIRLLSKMKSDRPDADEIMTVIGSSRRADLRVARDAAQTALDDYLRWTDLPDADRQELAELLFERLGTIEDAARKGPDGPRR